MQNTTRRAAPSLPAPRVKLYLSLVLRGRSWSAKRYNPRVTLNIFGYFARFVFVSTDLAFFCSENVILLGFIFIHQLFWHSVGSVVNLNVPYRFAIFVYRHRCTGE